MRRQQNDPFDAWLGLVSALVVDPIRDFARECRRTYRHLGLKSRRNARRQRHHERRKQSNPGDEP